MTTLSLVGDNVNNFLIKLSKKCFFIFFTKKRKQKKRKFFLSAISTLSLYIYHIYIFIYIYKIIYKYKFKFKFIFIYIMQVSAKSAFAFFAKVCILLVRCKNYELRKVSCVKFTLCLSESFGLRAKINEKYFKVELLEPICDIVGDTMPNVEKNLIYRFFYADTHNNLSVIKAS